MMAGAMSHVGHPVKLNSILLLVVAVFGAWPASAALGQVAAADSLSVDLAKGIHEVREGEFSTAVMTLESVGRRLAIEPARRPDVSRARLYLSAALLGLGQEQRATAAFLEALEADPDLELSTDEFPPKFLTFFMRARERARGARSTSPIESTPPASPSPSTIQEPGKKGHALQVGLGVIAAAGAIAVVSAQGSDGSGGVAESPAGPRSNPTPAPTPTPGPPFIPRAGTWAGSFVQFYVGANGLTVTNEQSPLEFSASAVLGPFNNISQRCLSVTWFIHAQIAVDNTLTFRHTEQSEAGTVSFSGQFSSPTTANGEFSLEFDFGSCRGQRSGSWTAVPR